MFVKRKTRFFSGDGFVIGLFFIVNLINDEVSIKYGWVKINCNRKIKFIWAFEMLLGQKPTEMMISFGKS